MNYRRLGRTGLFVSVIGLGTCQLRLVPERQAIETLLRGFELGVNLVHVAPDYEGADRLVAKAIRESSRDVIVCSQGYGSPGLFERFFEDTCRAFDKEHLELFGIACIDDREIVGENVWGTGGMVEYLMKKREEGRLGCLFCTTHGTPEYIRALIESNVFDALMIPYNILGFHLLTASLPGKEPENLHRNKDIVFPAARKQDVGIMVMKPLAGGLLCQGKAFPSLARLMEESGTIKAEEALRYILMNKDVSCVVPGTASVEEAEENALSGWGEINLKKAEIEILEQRAQSLEAVTCSRCGDCDGSCSQNLPISWLFRAAYIGNYPSETFETPDTHEYFRLHPSEEALCERCEDITCTCTKGIDIPIVLTRIHGQMKKLRSKGLIPSAEVHEIVGHKNRYRAKLILKKLPLEIVSDKKESCLLYLENSGQQPWYAKTYGRQPQILLCVYFEEALVMTIQLRHDVHPTQRAHFAFELSVTPSIRTPALSLYLAEAFHRLQYRRVLPILDQKLIVMDSDSKASPTK